MNTAIAQPREETNTKFSKFVDDQLSKCDLFDIKQSSFLEILYVAFFIGAEHQFCKNQNKPGLSTNPLVYDVIQKLHKQEERKTVYQYRSVTRLIEKFVLVEAAFKKGKESFNGWLKNNATSKELLYNLMLEHRNSSMMDLSNEGFTKEHARKTPHPVVISQATPAKAPPQPIQIKSKKLLVLFLIWMSCLFIGSVTMIGWWLMKDEIDAFLFTLGLN